MLINITYLMSGIRYTFHNSSSIELKSGRQSEIRILIGCSFPETVIK